MRPTRLSIWEFVRMLVLVAVGFSTLVGIVFGIYPALKAARFDPINALRFERGRGQAGMWGNREVVHIPHIFAL